MKALFYTLVILSAVSLTATAQTNTFPSTGAAGIGTTSPNASSLLEIKSTAKGFLMPRMTLAQRNAIASPATGLLIYQTSSTPGFYYYTGTAWAAVTAKAGWSLTGNAGTDSSKNFLGTTDKHPLVFKVNNNRSGLIDYIGNNNTSFGYQGLLSNTTGFYNTSVGYNALKANKTSGRNTAIGAYALLVNTAENNTAVGTYALVANTNGIGNVATGVNALQANVGGNNNAAFGTNTLYANVSGTENTATGVSALFSNISGNDNTATGFAALNSNTANQNTAHGGYALYLNTNGADNTADGYAALYQNTTGVNNAALGAFALSTNLTGSNNTAVGISSGPASEDLSFTTAVGYGASTTSSYQVRIGSIGTPGDPTSIGGKVGWSTLSDGRVKKNIKENVPGLVFINKLKPITYNLDNDAINKIGQHSLLKDKDGKVIQLSANEAAGRKIEEKIIHTGFIAQDVEKAAKSLNYDFSGVDAAKNDKDLYGLRYAEFVVPLVKAVQELSAKNDDLQKQIDELKAMIVSNQSSAFSQQSTNISSASLQQNTPNPFNNTTTINYTLPQKFTTAQIIMTDKSGNTLKAIKITANGKGSLTIDASTLASGTYQYSLIIDGKLIDTKQMVMAK